MGANCVASTSIGCFLCCKGFSADKVRNAFTFVPPRPSYSVKPDPKDESAGEIVYVMPALNSSAIYRKAAESAEVRWLRTAKGSRVPIVWVGRGGRGAPLRTASNISIDGVFDSRPPPPPLVLLHCHGNATDIGMMMGPYFELVRVLGIEVVGVEYTGYGAASGKPSSSNTYADAEAAFDFIVASGVPPSRIVAYGQSVGSGPACFLAATKKLCGLILHSPLLSGIKVVDPHPDNCCRPSCVWGCFDFYPNDRRAKHMRCPSFIMHGQRDDIIPFYHGYRLHHAFPKDVRWPAYFPQRAGHNDLMETDTRSYFGELANFLGDLRKIAAGEKVHPPSGHRPIQIRSISGIPPAVLIASVGPAVAAAASSEPSSCDENHSAKPDQLAPAMSPVDFLGGVHEPIVGPEDGRYEQLRAGHLMSLPADRSLLADAAGAHR